jgi:cyclopropane fatty-acyl-phospholipid synthase-like methyltransferase
VFNSPMSADRADYLIDALDLTRLNQVVEPGCGDGAFLRRAASRTRITATGIDNDATLIEEANALWSSQSSSSKLKFVCDDAVTYLESMSSVDVMVCIGAEYIFGGYAGLLKAAKEHLKRGGRLLVGTIYWKQPPSAEYLALMDGENPNFDLPTTVEMAYEMGFLPLEVHRSNHDEWDAFESSHTRSRYLEAADESSRKEAWDWQRGYLKWGMDTMGFCFLVLQNQNAD